MSDEPLHLEGSRGGLATFCCEAGKLRIDTTESTEVTVMLLTPEQAKQLRDWLNERFPK